MDGTAPALIDADGCLAWSSLVSTLPVCACVNVSRCGVQVPPSRMSRRSLLPNPDPTVWVPWFRSGARVGTTGSHGLLQVFLQVRIHEGDVDFTAHGAGAGAGTGTPSPLAACLRCRVGWHG